MMTQHELTRQLGNAPVMQLSVGSLPVKTLLVAAKPKIQLKTGTKWLLELGGGGAAEEHCSLFNSLLFKSLKTWYGRSFRAF